MLQIFVALNLAALIGLRVWRPEPEPKPKPVFLMSPAELWDLFAGLDADVISIEASRSDMELLEAFAEFSYPNEIGPGIWDIHSPRVPGEAELERLLVKAAGVIPADRIWVNPDCGLKTRGWPEVEESLKGMVAVADRLRQAAE